MEPRDRVRVGNEKVPLWAVCGRSRGEVGTGQGTGETERGVNKSRLRAVSPKRRPEVTARKKLIAKMKRNGPVLCARCGGFADDLHEPGKRSAGADPSDPEQVVAVCRPCHDHIHRNVSESVAAGWLHSVKVVK